MVLRRSRSPFIFTQSKTIHLYKIQNCSFHFHTTRQSSKLASYQNARHSFRFKVYVRIPMILFFPKCVFSESEEKQKQCFQLKVTKSARLRSTDLYAQNFFSPLSKMYTVHFLQSQKHNFCFCICL